MAKYEIVEIAADHDTFPFHIRTTGLRALNSSNFQFSFVADALREPIARVLSQLGDAAAQGHRFFAGDEIDLGLGRVKFEARVEDCLDVFDGNPTKNQAVPAATFMTELAVDAGQFYLRHGGVDPALQLFSVATSYRDDCIAAHRGRAFCLVLRDDFPGAIASLGDALERAKKTKDILLPWLHQYRALLQHDLAIAADSIGARDELIHKCLLDYTQAIKWDPSAEVLFHRARAHRLKGDDHQAEQDLQQILGDNPQLNPSALRAVVSNHMNTTGRFTRDFIPRREEALQEIMEEDL